MSDAPLIGTREMKHEGPLIRLLMCFVCNTLEELPDYDGPVEQDYLLEISIEKHVFPSGEPHKGKLFKLPVKSWATADQRKAILGQLSAGGSRGLDELDPDKSFYDTKMTFMEDAMKCYAAHNRPKIECPDYGSPQKRLLPNSAKERAELNLPKPEHADGPKIYLCNFCPMHSTVTTNNRLKQGLYKS
jgi:hypothetical protein